jgi:hypothetical protein
MLGMTSVILRWSITENEDKNNEEISKKKKEMDVIQPRNPGAFGFMFFSPPNGVLEKEVFL